MQRIIIFYLITLLGLWGYSGKAFAQSTNSQLESAIRNWESEIRRYKERLAHLENELSEELYRKEQLLKKGHTIAEEGALGGDNPLRAIEKEIYNTQGGINYCKSEIERLQNNINNAREEDRRLKEELEKRIRQEQQAKRKREEEQRRQNELNKRKEQEAREAAERQEQERIRRERERIAEEERRRREEEERRRREEYGNMVRDQKLDELHAKNAGRREHLSQLSEELEIMHDNVNTLNHQQEMLGDGNWERLQAGKAESPSVNLNITNPELRRQMNLGKMKVKDNITSDIESYLLSNIGKVRDVPLDEYFCDYVKQKVLSYYHVDNLKFMTKQCDPALEAEIIKTTQDYSEKANQMMRNKIDDCNNNKQAPTWEMLRNIMRGKDDDKGLDRFVSTINILATSNSGVLPTPLGSDKNYYYYRLAYSQKVARMSIKKPGMIDVVSCDFEYRDLESLMSSMQGKSVMTPYVALFNQGINMKSYNVLTDGSAKGKITDKSGNILEYKVKAPHLEIYTNGEVVLRNSFDETYTSNHDYSDIEFSAELGFKYFGIKLTSDNGLTLTGKWVDVAEVEITKKDGSITNVGGKGKITPVSTSTNYNLEKGSNTVGGSIKVNGETFEDIVGKKMKDDIKSVAGNVQKGTVGINYTPLDNGYTIGGSGKIQNGMGGLGISGSRTVSQNDDETQHEKNKLGMSFDAGKVLKFGMSSSHEFDKASLSSENNTYVAQLPSGLLTEIYSKKFEDFTSKGLPMYSDMKKDHEGVITKVPILPNELNNIKAQLLETASKANSQDFKYKPSDFNLFGTCLSNYQQ